MKSSLLFIGVLTLTACQDDIRIEDASGVTSTGGSTSAGQGGHGGEDTIASTTSTTTAASTSSSGTGGGPTAFAAGCSGLLDCPMFPGCAQWAYDVDDDGVISDVVGTITLLEPVSAPPCTQSVSIDDAEDTGPVKGTVTLQCGNQQWTLGLDRGAMVVYVTADPMGLSWTPACR